MEKNKTDMLGAMTIEQLRHHRMPIETKKTERLEEKPLNEHEMKLKLVFAREQPLLVEQIQRAQIERIKEVEGQLETLQEKWRDSDQGWRATTEENNALKFRLRVLAEENVALHAKLAAATLEAAALREDPHYRQLIAAYELRMKTMEAEFNARLRAEVDCVAASLYEQIKALKGRR